MRHEAFLPIAVIRRSQSLVTILLLDLDIVEGEEWVHWAGGHLIVVNWDIISVTATLNTLTAVW